MMKAAALPSASRVALVTGGVRRIGAAIVEQLAQRGYAVVIHCSARSAAEARESVAKLQDRGVLAVCVVADLGDASDVDALIAQASGEFGPIDVLVNNASIFEDDDIASFDVERFDRIQAVNLRAPLVLSKHFAAQARADRDPSIINVLDQRVFAPNPLYFSYSLSKSALAKATTVLAQALAPAVRVNAVAPGPVLPNEHEGRDRFEAEVAEVALARSVSLKEIADAVDYLVSARSVTGQVIAVDSGQRLAWRTPDVVASMGGR